jgi:PAS domain S-box-containing protein
VKALPSALHQPPLDTGLDAELLRMFFDRAPMGIALFDRDLRLQRCNATWVGLFAHHHGVDTAHVLPGRTVYEILPDTEADLAPLVDDALRGQTVQREALRIHAHGTTTYWDLMFAPASHDGEVVGVVNVITDATERVTAYQHLRRRIAAFATVAEAMTVDQPLRTTLSALARTAAEVSDAEACAVVIVDPDTNLLTTFEAWGLPEGYADAIAESWRRGVRSPSREALEHQTLTHVADARGKGLENPLYEPLYPYLRTAAWDDMVIVPLDSRGRCLGVMQYYHRPGRTHDDEERTFLTALADQAALAVTNADLYARSERDAALLERQRLARELHDSVSQALFSMTLHARTAERQLTAAGVARDAPAAETVRRLADLTQGALAEMRALIFELRPGALAQEGLVTALQRQAAALTAREAVPIEVTGPAERPVLDPSVEEHLYRLTLEALNNAVKHAAASRITVSITLEDSALALCVADDGLGFDPTQQFPGHLGQTTMAERAAAISGELAVDSTPGAGCRITVRVPVHPPQDTAAPAR